MVDISSNIIDGLKKIGERASQSVPSSGGNASTFQSILLEAQRQRVSAWSQTGLNAPEPVNLFNEYRIILEQARAGQNPEKPLEVRPAILNPRLAAQNYELQSALVSLESPAQNTGDSFSLSLPDLALLAGGLRGVPGALFQQLIQNESAFNPNAVGSRGGLGLGQLTPDLALEMGLRLGQDRSEGSVWHPASNLDGSARHLKALYDRFTESGVSTGEAWRFATGAYNAGLASITQAMDLLQGSDRTQWDRVAGELSRITGSRAQETIEYVERLP